MQAKETELKVSGQTNPNKLGGAIQKFLDEEGKIVLTAMGDRAVSQAVKGIIVAQSYLASTAKSLNLRMGFLNRYDERLEKDVTVIAFYITHAS